MDGIVRTSVPDLWRTAIGRRFLKPLRSGSAPCVDLRQPREEIALRLPEHP
jgi:hypothetical protein